MMWITGGYVRGKKVFTGYAHVVVEKYRLFN